MIRSLRLAVVSSELTLKAFQSNSTDYVRRVKEYEKLKGNDQAVTDVFQRSSQFVLFLNHQPLLSVTPTDQPNQSGMEYNMRRLSYNELAKCAESHKFRIDSHNSALLDVLSADPLEPLFSYGLRIKDVTTTDWDHTDEENFQSSLESSLNGQFFDFRRALFTLTHPYDLEMVSKSQSVLRWSKSFKFCSSCGGRVKLKLSKAFADCTSCAKVHYPSVSPVGIVLVEDPTGQFCLLVRQPRHLSGVYTAIAGFGEAGETIENTVRREVAEEVGLEVDNLRYAQMSQAWPIPHCSLMFAFIATAKSRQEPDIDRTELEDGRWFSREQVMTAYHNTKALRKSNNFTSYGLSNEFEFLPPKGAIAYELIRQWLKEPPHL